MERKLTCIVCPRGCALTVTLDGENAAVSGNSCPRGAEYGIAECTHPTRTVTSTVRLSNREDAMVSVKTAAPIPKEHIFDAMAAIRALAVEAPVAAGTVLIDDLFGASLIATSSVE